MSLSKDFKGENNAFLEKQWACVRKYPVDVLFVFYIQILSENIEGSLHNSLYRSMYIFFVYELLFVQPYTTKDF